ncbi:hypothetical protein JCM8115_003775 [Rhodotorula mucilaginosa]
MADYWISRDKYFCKYCNIYIADDKPSRLHHETGLRHKGNYERYIRDIYKKGAQQKRDRAEEAKELARVEAAAAAAMGLPPPELSTSSSASTSKPKPTPAAPTKPADPYANYTTAANLGIRDEAAERAAAEAEQRRNEGVIGSWQKVVKPKPPPRPPADSDVKGKRRAAEEWEGQGFAGQAVLRPELAGGVKRESGDGGEDRDERKPDSLLAQTAGDDKPRPVLRTSTALDDDHEQDESNLNVVEAAKKRGFLSEKSAVSYYDDDDPLANIGPIKLKKRRLTVKEQQAEEEARLAKQREVEEILKAREESRRAGGNRGWAQLDRSALEAEEEEFDPLAGLEMPAADEPEAGPEQEEYGDEKKTPLAAPVDTQAQPAGGLFKKRKRPGAMKSK